VTPIDSVRPAAGTAAPQSRDELARLRKTAQQMEGVFVQQLFKAMRETVPHEGVDGDDAGQEMFTALFDEKIATEAPAHWSHGLADAIARQMSHRLGTAGTAAAASNGVAGTHAPTDSGSR